MDLISVEAYTQYPAVKPDATFSYGNSSHQFGDLYLPNFGGLHPVIVLIHGGCWREQYDLKPLGTMCRALVSEGFAVWNIEYRREGNGGDWPHMFFDVAYATDYLRQIAVKYNLNLEQVLTVGHSAGGHLALWLAARQRIPFTSELYIKNPLMIRGVVSLAGIADLVHAIENDVCEGALAVVMGGDNQTVPEHYQVGSPHALLPLGVPQTHIIGEHDAAFMDTVKSYVTAAQKAGDEVELMIPSNAGHFELVSVASETWQIVRDAIVTLRDSIAY